MTVKIVTQKIQDDIKTITDAFVLMRHEAEDLFNLYWKGGVKTDNDALAGGAAATLTTKLAKEDIVTGLTYAEQIDKFFDNQALATADYMTSIQVLTHGNVAIPTLVSDRLEEFGDRIKQLSQDSITQYQRCKNVENLYNSSEVGTAIGSISDFTIVYGAEMTKNDLTSAITLAQNWCTFLDNGAPGTADRKVTLGKWDRL